MQLIKVLEVISNHVFIQIVFKDTLATNSIMCNTGFNRNINNEFHFSV